MNDIWTGAFPSLSAFGFGIVICIAFRIAVGQIYVLNREVRNLSLDQLLNFSAAWSKCTITYRETFLDLGSRVRFLQEQV